MAINFAAVRQAHSLADFCSSRGIKLKRSGSDGTLVSLCPLHDERTPSFYVYPDEHFCCYGCGAHGDVLALCSKLDGLTVVQAAKKLGGGSKSYSSQTKIAHDRSEPAIRPTKQNPLALPYQMSSEEIRECGRCAERLITNAQAIQALVDWRGWSPSTIRDLALEPAIGLTINAHLALLYSSGLKTRVIGSRKFQFFGKLWIWRGELIPQFQNIYIFEGETDAIRLINDGLECDGLTLAVALPSASFNIAPWKFLFQGKSVTLIPDNDLAGSECLERLVKVLEPQAQSIAILDWRAKT
jgi:DNA primase